MAEKKTTAKKTAVKKTTAKKTTRARTTRARKAAPKKTPASKAAPRRTTRKRSAAVPAPQPAAQDIAVRAYYLWKLGGADPVANWLTAESELRAGA